jgi:hypothetical protein
MQPRAIPVYTGLPPARGVEPGRFVLLDAAPESIRAEAQKSPFPSTSH